MIARFEDGNIGFPDLGPVLEFPFQEGNGRTGIAMVFPVEETQDEHVFTTVFFLRAQSRFFEAFPGECRDRYFANVIALEAVVFNGVDTAVISKAAVFLIETVRIDNDAPPLPEMTDVCLEGRGIHSHEDVELVARSEDAPAAKMKLKPGNAGQRSLRSPDLGREIRKGSQVDPGQRRVIGEKTAGQLHAVARITGEFYRYFFPDFRRLLHGNKFETCRLPGACL